MASTGSNKLRFEILTKEISVWQALVAGDSKADRDALHEDFLGVYPSGFSNKEEHVAQLAEGPTVLSFELSQEQILELGPDHACLCYLARYQRVGSEEWEEMYVSSIWRRLETEGQSSWVNVFSQDTPADGRSVV